MLNGKIITGVALGFFALVVLLIGGCQFYTVDSGERAIVLSWGKVNGVEEAGMHVKIPFRDDVVKVNVRTQAATAEAAASSKDMQNVHTTVSVNYHLDPAHVGEIYAKTGIDVETKIIDPRIQEYVKAVTARYAADELLKQREVVKVAITEALTRELQAYNIVVEQGGVQITNFKFDPAYQQAIENKQIAEQKALQATNDLQRIKVEAQQDSTRAIGTANAIRIQVEAIRAQGGSEYVQLKALEKWNGVLPSYMGGNGPIPFLSVK